ncbi:MAG: hypothetical protein AAF682_27420 [Planctomycetota bacterium]
MLSPAKALRSALLLTVLPAAASAQLAVDLNTWADESYPAVSGFGPGVWTVAPDGSSVNQSVNGQPTLFYSDFNVFNTEVEGQITVGGGDDDFVGFVLGYEPSNVTNPGAEYLLVDWKAGTQGFDFGAPSCTPGANAPAGLAVSRVIGVPTADEFWGHTNFDDPVCSDLSNGLEELARGVNLGDTGWSAGTTYTFRFEFDATSLKVFVDGVLELDISGSFSNGRMGFYNFSQANVTYNAFTLDCSAQQEIYGNGWAGTLGVPALTASANPVLGTTIQINVGNAYGADTIACILVSGQAADDPTDFGGALLVGLPEDYALSVHPLSPGGDTLIYNIPDDITLCGVDFFAQLIHEDPAATHGIAFSRGLRLTHGL